jgi:uncharacterized protein YkwD
VDAPGKIRATIAALVLSIGVAAPAAAQATPRHPTRVESETLRLINIARADKGLKPVRLDLRLWRAARHHTGDMLKRGYFAHGATTQRLARYVHGAGVVGETLAWGSGTYRTPASTVRSWLDSPPHRALLLDPDFSYVGIGSRGGSFQGEQWARVYTADFRG